MNNDKKDTNPTGNLPEPEGNPWDEDESGGGRTLAMDGPSFEMPSNIPSPISNPPPPLVLQTAPTPFVPVKPMGLGPPPGLRPNPASERMPAIRKTAGTAQMVPAKSALATSTVGSVPRATPRAIPAGVPVLSDGVDPPEEAATAAVALPGLEGLPHRHERAHARHSPMASTGYRPQETPLVDKDAETKVGEAVVVRHQDAQLIVGGDADGDENTLAVSPEALDGGIGGSVADTLRRQREQYDGGPPQPPSNPNPYAQQQTTHAHGHQQTPAFAMAPPNYQSSSGHLPAAAPQSHGQMGMAQPQSPSWGSTPANPGYDPTGYDPMLPGTVPGTAPHPFQPAPNPNAMTAPQQLQQAQQPPLLAVPRQGWATPRGPQAPTMLVPRESRFTPQVLLLIAVGAFCLAIFIIGIVLFVTTKF